MYAGKLTTVVENRLLSDSFILKVEMKPPQMSWLKRIKINFSEIAFRLYFWERFVANRVNNHHLTSFKSIGVVEDKARVSFKNLYPLLLVVAGNDDNASRLIWLKLDTFPCTTYSQRKRYGIEGDGILKEYAVIGGNDKIVDEGETWNIMGVLSYDLAFSV